LYSKLVHFYSKLFGVICFQTGAQRNEIALAGPHHDVAHARARLVRAPCRLGVHANVAPPEATRRPRPHLPHSPTPRGSLESSRAARSRLSAPYRLGVRDGLLVCLRRPAVRTPVEAAGPRPHLRGHAVVIAGRVPLFKATIHTRTRHHCHSRRHDRRLSELPFFPSVSSSANTPNTSSNSHVSRSLCLWASRKPPSPATPPTAATAAGPRRAPTPAISPPQLRPPPGS
jgi:hypothetical protein